MSLSFNNLLSRRFVKQLEMVFLSRFITNSRKVHFTTAEIILDLEKRDLKWQLET